MIKEGAFGGTYFRDIYSDINEKWYKNSWEEFLCLKNIEVKLYASDYYDVSGNKYGRNVEHHQDFGKIRVRLRKKALMDGFSGILVTGQEEDQKMIKDK